jgi:hypothetical protein
MPRPRATAWAYQKVSELTEVERFEPPEWPAQQHAGSDGPVLYCYLRCIPSNRILICSTFLGSLRNLCREYSYASPIEVNGIFDGLSSLLKTARLGVRQRIGAPLLLNQEIGNALIHALASTKTIRNQFNLLFTHRHLLLNIYEGGNRGNVFRSVLYDSEATLPIKPGEVTFISDEIGEADRKDHPDWFA